MRQHQELGFGRIERKRLVVQFLRCPIALKQSAVDQKGGDEGFKSRAMRAAAKNEEEE